MPYSTKEFLAARMENFLQSRLHEETMAKKRLLRPSLTISRQTGAGLERIKRKLVEYLDEVDETDGGNWAYFDQSLVGEVIKDSRLDKSVEPYLVENTKIPVVEALEQILNLHPSEWTLFNHTANTIRKLCKAGHAIGVGRAGNFVTSDLPNTFHIRLVGSLENRIAEIQRQFENDEKSAKAMIVDTEKARAKFVKRYTGAEITDSCLYHLTINTDNLNDDLLVKLIGDCLLEWAFEQEKSRRNAS
jgi:cytidylate kinase